ncbi:MAG: orotidine-5'-phosphate decarboxylase [Oleiphilaceae bacterium]|nr:orotidine-5'-phosphate decarboxylase [Oleiphilaceae bacterium]
MQTNNDPKIIVALDFASERPALELADNLDPALCRVKVGKELFTRSGPALVRKLQDRGLEVFLDLKFHDIPNTTSAAVAAAADMGVWMVNVHASGGEKMLLACRERLQSFGPGRPWLIAVTVLTSMTESDFEAIGIAGTPADQVARLAALTARCGLDGVVCSAKEAAMLKREQGAGFKLITPGIRPAEASHGDQKRVVTPAEAIAAGSDYLVIGRPVTQADNPLTALQAIHQDLGTPAG